MNPLKFDISELQRQLNIDQNLSEEKQKEKGVKKKKIPAKPKGPYKKSSVAFKSLEIDEQGDNETKEKRVRKSSKIVNVNCMLPSNDEFDKILPDSSHLLPTDVEPGSMVILVNKIPNTIGHNTLQAYVAQAVNGETKMMPIYLESNVLLSIAKEMNILKSGEKYTMATPEKKHRLNESPKNCI
jgi:hypothetical protein